jgi:hypothetical protein
VCAAVFAMSRIYDLWVLRINLRTMTVLRLS